MLTRRTTRRNDVFARPKGKAMDISITLETMLGMNWDLWKRTIPLVEELGFTGLYRSDHIMVGEAGSDSPELITSLTYLGDHSQRLLFGSMVAPLSVHNPIELTRQAMALNDLSGGRMVIGVGSGWHEPEHEMFGFNLGDKKTRMDRFEEGVRVMRALIHSSDPVDFEGRFFHLKAASLAPRSPVRILIGGNGPTRTLPLVARHADVWNAQMVNAPEFKTVNLRLTELVEAAGRDPRSVKRTVMVPVVCWRTDADLERLVTLFQRDVPRWRAQSYEEARGFLLNVLHGPKGSPQRVIDDIGAYVENGAEEVIIEWFALSALEAIELVGREVLPAFAPHRSPSA